MLFVNDQDLYTRLLHIEEEFLDCLPLGPDALVPFQENWAALQSDVERRMQTSTLLPRTVTLAQSVASRVGTIAEAFLEFDIVERSLTNDFMEEFEAILCLDTSSKSSNEISSPREDVIPILPLDTISSCPPYIGAAYKWLLQNLDNPYPTLEAKRILAKTSGASVERISAWFTNVRHRMGWTAVARKFYANCRADTVDGAYRCFVEDDPLRPLEASIAYEFMMMKAVAESLYSAKFKKSTLAGKLDSVVKDMTEEDRAKLERLKEQAAWEDKQRRELEKEKKRRERAREREARKVERSVQERAQSSYPSPDRSLCTSPEPFPVPQSDNGEEDLTPPVPVAGHKRRASSSSSSSDSTDIHLTNWNDYADRPNKRHRIECTLPEGFEENPCVSLPSPESRPHSPPDFCDRFTSPLSSSLDIPSAITAPHANRKRRLSDADACGAPKRPRGFPVGPRVHAVSDPLPMSTAVMQASAFEDWFKVNFDPPPAVTAEEPDTSAPLDVEIFSDWTSWDDINSFEGSTGSASMSNASPVSVQHAEVSDEQLSSLTPPAFDMSTLPTRPDHNLDFLDSIDIESLFLPSLHSEHQAPVTPGEQTAAPLVAVAAPTSSASHEEANVDWTQLASCLFGNNAPSAPSDPIPKPLPADIQNFVRDFPNLGGPLDSSLLQLSTPSPTDILAQQHDEAARLAAEKQAKLDQLRAHREAARKLEEELLAT